MKWGKEDATDAEIWEALTTAQAKEVVEGKQDQLDFMLEQNGKTSPADRNSVFLLRVRW